MRLFFPKSFRLYHKTMSSVGKTGCLSGKHKNRKKMCIMKIKRK